LATLANGQRVSEDITEVMVKPRRPGIISLPLYTIAGFLRPYPRFYQIVGFFFILIGGFGYVARRISGGKSLDDPPFYAYVIGGIVVLVCATIARQQKAEEEAITKPRRDREKEKVEALLRRIQENPFKCPKCGSSEVVKHHPSKPVVFSPMTFTGILTGGIANAMADKIFRPEVVCQSCGCRWEMPD
jgi:transcription elongation factor Elf1